MHGREGKAKKGKGGEGGLWPGEVSVVNTRDEGDKDGAKARASREIWAT